MGWRFQKRIKLGKFLTLNLSKSGTSLTVGGKGAKLNINDKGEVKRTLSIQGTGLSNTKKIGNLKKNKDKDKDIEK